VSSDYCPSCAIFHCALPTVLNSAEQDAWQRYTLAFRNAPSRLHMALRVSNLSSIQVIQRVKETRIQDQEPCVVMGTLRIIGAVQKVKQLQSLNTKPRTLTSLEKTYCPGPYIRPWPKLVEIGEHMLKRRVLTLLRPGIITLSFLRGFTLN
jgi:hypothetical protein